MRPIDADALKKLRDDYIQGRIEFNGNENDLIDMCPTVDAEPARHGCEYCSGDKVKYQYTPYTTLYIDTLYEDKVLVTECNFCPPYAECCMKDVPVRSVFKINYCPNCGAKMNGGQKENAVD